MTEREALKLALEALEKSHTCPLLPDDCAEAITAIKEALEQPEHGWTPERIAGIARLKDAQDKRLAQPSVSVEQEPVAWMYEVNNAHTCLDLFEPPDDAYDEGTLHPLYTTPLQRKPLTDEQCDAIYTALDQWAREFDQHEFGLPSHCGDGMVGGREIIRRAIEAAHGIKGEA